MARIEVSKAKIRKVLQRIERARADAEVAPEEKQRLSEWEDEYLGSVKGRVDAFGSAFRDATLGRPGEPLSRRQKQKLDEIDAKVRGEPRFARKAPMKTAAPKDAGARAKDRPQAKGGLKRKTPLGARKPPFGGR